MVAQTLPDLPELTPEQAEHWVAAALAEARALRQHQDQLFPATNDPQALSTSERVRGAWHAWLAAAEALLVRLRPLLDSRRHVIGAYDLDYAVGRAHAMLSLSPDAMRQRREQVRAGQVHTVEEVRRDLSTSSRG